MLNKKQKESVATALNDMVQTYRDLCEEWYLATGEDKGGSKPSRILGMLNKLDTACEKISSLWPNGHPQDFDRKRMRQVWGVPPNKGGELPYN